MPEAISTGESRLPWVVANNRPWFMMKAVARRNAYDIVENSGSLNWVLRRGIALRNCRVDMLRNCDIGAIAARLPF